MDSQIAAHNVYYGSVAINLEKYIHAGAILMVATA